MQVEKQEFKLARITIAHSSIHLKAHGVYKNS